MVAEESQFYYDNDNEKKYIDFSSDITSQSLTIIETDVARIYQTYDRFDLSFRASLQVGEMQAITILCDSQWNDLQFCTADGFALIACCLFNLEDRCISLEMLLKSCGLQANLKSHFAEAKFSSWKKKGIERRIQGIGLVK